MLISYNYSFVICSDPAVDELVTFPIDESKPAMTYSNKQLIAHEVELERIRRNTIVTHGASEEKTTSKKDQVQPVQPSVPNHLQKLNVKEVALKSKTVSDFFFIPYL